MPKSVLIIEEDFFIVYDTESVRDEVDSEAIQDNVDGKNIDILICSCRIALGFRFGFKFC